MKRNDTVYIVGHKNPDTDSICSAIAYADIKNRTQPDTVYQPMRAGHINEETEFVLRYFNAETPKYLPDAAIQVKEIEYHRVEGVRGEISVKQAWNTMQALNVVTLPITDEENYLKGLITVSDIAKSYMDVYDNAVLSEARTQYRSIAETLDGRVIVGNEEDYFDEGRVIIGAFQPDLMGNMIRPHDLVLLGNRAEDQLVCLDLEVSCIVVGLGAQISPTIQRLAREVGCVLISSPHDTYTIARLINQAIPIKHLMKSDKLITFHLNDRVDDIKEVMKVNRHRDYPVLDRKDHYMGTVSRRNLIGASGKRLILVDHNERSQALDNVDEAQILEIIDHHRLGSLETMSPILFRNQPVGCTATILYQIYQEQDLEIQPQIAGLLCSAILSDTLMFHSPTCTPMDRAAAKALAATAGIEDMEKYAAEMFRAGSSLKNKSPEEVLYQDFKKFDIEGISFAVGQISSMDEEELVSIRRKILPQLRPECERHGLKMLFFMLTSILDESTDLLYVGEGAEELIHDAFHVHPEEESCLLKGVISRKKQLIPGIMAALQQRVQEN